MSQSASSPSSFKIFVPFTGAHIEKGTNKMIVEGLASTTETDLTGERMAESAIKAMAAPTSRCLSEVNTVLTGTVN